MAEQETRNIQQEQDLKQILKVRRDKLKALQDMGMDPFTITKYDVTHHAQEIKDNFDALEGQTVSVGGRLMSDFGFACANLFLPYFSRRRSASDCVSPFSELSVRLNTSRTSSR